MIVLKLRFIPAAAVLLALASLPNVSCEDSAEVAESGKKPGPGDYWSMPTITNALIPLSDLFAPPTCSPHPLERVFENPDFAPLFAELPQLKGELEELGPGDQSNAEFLFKVYVSLSSKVTPFFHRAVAVMTEQVPKMRDLAKFNIAAELSTYVQSIVDPIPNVFSEIAKFKLTPKNNDVDVAVGTTPKNNHFVFFNFQKPANKPGFKVPPQREIKNVVGRVVLKNIGAPPLIPFVRLHVHLSSLVKSYVERQRHNFSSDQENSLIPLQDDNKNDTRQPEIKEATPHLQGTPHIQGTPHLQETPDFQGAPHIQRLQIPSEVFEKMRGIIIKLAT